MSRIFDILNDKRSMAATVKEQRWWGKNQRSVLPFYMSRDLHDYTVYSEILPWIPVNGCQNTLYKPRCTQRESRRTARWPTILVCCRLLPLKRATTAIVEACTWRGVVRDEQQLNQLVFGETISRKMLTCLFYVIYQSRFHSAIANSTIWESFRYVVEPVYSSFEVYIVSNSRYNFFNKVDGALALSTLLHAFRTCSNV